VIASSDAMIAIAETFAPASARYTRRLKVDDHRRRVTVPCNPSPRAFNVEGLATVHFAMFGRDQPEMLLRVLVE
jgi:hypothetical protein